MAFTANVDGHGVAPLAVHVGASRKAAAPVANRTTRLSWWDDDSPGWSHGRYAILMLTGWP